MPEYVKLCMSCGRELRQTCWLNLKWRVPDEVDCCSWCWHRVPVAERLKIVIQISTFWWARSRSVADVICIFEKTAF